ncbi:MAG: flagellar hook-associated protein FlgL [Sulfuricella sp.]|nr:flagellar hook-associated protein FlgL [Sulfuricella sp.]
MRISTNTIFDLGIAGIQQQSSAQVKTQQQLASGRRILTPADDPVAAARVLEVSQSKAINQQYDVNTNSAASALGLEDGTLTSIENLIQSVRDVAITAGGPSMDGAALKNLAVGLTASYQQLLGLANTKDGNGQYMFSGYKGATQPFSETSPGNVAYNGDQGQRLMQISPSRQIAVSDAGSDVFYQNKNGTNQSLFTTLNKLISDLNAGVTSNLQSSISDLDNGLNQVLSVHVSVGQRMNENDAVKSSGQSTALQYDQTLSGLQDLDYAQATIDLNKQSLGLQAAQQSFAKIQGLSLFNYIN